MTTSLPEEQQKLSGNDIVNLITVDLTSLGGSTYYFTSSADESAAIVFDGNTYTPIDIELSGFEWTGVGPVPSPTVKLSNATGIFTTIVQTYADLLGAEVTRLRTFRRFLDGETDADPTAYFPSDVYVIERKVGINKHYIEFELSAKMDQRGRKIPARVVMRDVCTNIYRRWDSTAAAFNYDDATCPYAGGGYYDIDDNATTASGDECSKKLSGCRLRNGNPLPFMGFPSISKFGNR